MTAFAKVLFGSALLAVGVGLVPHRDSARDAASGHQGDRMNARRKWLPAGAALPALAWMGDLRAQAKAPVVIQRLAGLLEMLLGADFLRAHRVLIANCQRKVYFTYAGGTVFPSRQGTPCDAPARDERTGKQSGKN